MILFLPLAPTATAWDGSARITGSGSVAVTANQRLVDVGANLGLGALTVNANQRIVAAAAFIGAGAVNFSAAILGAPTVWQGAALITGGGAVNALATGQVVAWDGAALITGAGAVKVLGQPTVWQGANRITGAGAVSALATVRLSSILPSITIWDGVPRRIIGAGAFTASATILAGVVDLFKPPVSPWGRVWQVAASIEGEAGFVITTNDPTATLTEYLSEPDRHVSYMSSFNDHIEIDLDSMTLAGRTDVGRGPAQSIIVPETPRDTLRLRNKKLTLDISGTRANFDDYVATTAVVIAQMQALIAQQAAALTALAKTTQSAGASLIAVNYYTNSQIIVIPPNARRCKVRMWGGTGGSGQAGGDFSSGYYPAPATSAAAYLEKFLDGLIPGRTLTFTFGAKGLGWRPDVFFPVPIPGQPATDGGSTILASGTQIIPTLTAGGSPTLAPLATPLPTTATGGDINIPGQAATGTYGAPDTLSHPGASPGVTLYSTGAAINPGFTGTGSDGTDGACIIEWFSGTDNPLNIAFAGVGTLTVNVERQVTHQQMLAAGIIGFGSLVVDGTRGIGPGTTLRGSGSLITADAIRMIGPGLTILGSGSLTCSAFIPPR